MSRLTYNDFLSTTNGTSWLNDINAFPNFIDHLNERFYDAEFLQKDENTIYRLLKNVLRNHYPKLKQIEILAQVVYSNDDLGINVTSDGKSKVTGDDSSSLSYTGYNVTGDYNSTQNTSKTKTKQSSKVNTLNKFKETIEYANIEMARLYDIIDDDLWMLFRQIY